MTKKEMLDILKTLSAMESATLAAKAHLPDYLLENLITCCEILEREILKESK